jgi:D-galactarolactone cycloisomerase
MTPITRADVLVLSHALSSIRLYGTGSNVTRDSVVVRVEDRDGAVGWGETFPVVGAVEAAREMAAFVVGRAPDTAIADVSAAGPVHRWALGAVAVAVDDLRAKQRGVPLGELYRPRVRDRVEAYASSRGYVDGQSAERAWHDEAEAIRLEGFRALKLRIGRAPLEQELPVLASLIRGHAELEWMADGNGAYGMDDALRLGRELGRLGARWLEEPLPTNDYAAYAPLARALDIPLSGGEITESPDLAIGPLDTGSFDIIQPDLSICGGVAPLLAIADAALARGVGCIPHACNGGILLAATLQVLAVLPALPAGPRWSMPILEYDVGENPIRTDLVLDLPPVTDGWLAIPERPGIGVEVDEAAVRRLAT